MPLGTPARRLGAVASTMDEARAWAEAGAPHGALVTATHQTAGRGRHGRAWLDAPGQNLLLSLVLRPAVPPGRLGLVGLAAGLALVDAAGALGVAAGLKWPNDVLVDGRKLAGVLAETRWAGAAPVVILGVGANVAQTSFADDVAGRATSITRATGRDVTPDAVLAPFLDALGGLLALLGAAPDALVARAERALVGREAPVRVAFPGTDRPPLAGRLAGLAPDGALRVATDAGEARLHAGEVTLSPDHPAPA